MMSDVLICCVVIDLMWLVWLGNCVLSGMVMLLNAVFLWLSDGGVYSSESSAADVLGCVV